MSQQEPLQPEPMPPMPAPSGLTPRPRAILPVYVAEMLERLTSLEAQIDEASKRIGSLEDGLTDIVRNFASCQGRARFPSTMPAIPRGSFRPSSAEASGGSTDGSRRENSRGCAAA